MRIGIMLRALDEKGGISVYSDNLTRELLKYDRDNQYILYYRNASNLGRFDQKDNVTERVINAKSKATWDQVGIPYAAWKDKVDVIFHPKFTVPLFAPCKTVMVLHGPGWFMPEFQHFWKPMDLKYIRAIMPLYCKRASGIISISKKTTEVFNSVLNLPPGKVRTVYFAPARHFKRVTDEAILRKARERYDLPAKFILTLTKPGGGERKNIGQIFKAYAGYHSQVAEPHKLIIGGKDCHLYRGEYGVPKDDYGEDILFPGWIDQADLPALYSLADLFLYPSNLEAFPIPITEAMACGTPIITSNVNGLEEIAGEAAFLVDPKNTGEITDAIIEVLSHSDLRQDLSSRGLARSKIFGWEKCARETVEILESLVK